MKKIIKRIIRYFGYDLVSNLKIQGIPANELKTFGELGDCLRILKRNGLQCETILDVGANRAEWSRMVRIIFPTARFHLIEPQIEMKPALDTFCKDFKGASYSLAGAGATSGHLTLTVWEDLLGSSFLPIENQDLKVAGKQRSIPIITIDDLVNDQIIKITLIKLDIQGFELEALKGASKTFGKTEVYIIEVSLFPFDDNLNTPLIHDVINFMLVRGYVIYDFPGFLRRPYDNALGQCDICFVKADGFLKKSNRWS